MNKEKTFSIVLQPRFLPLLLFSKSKPFSCLAVLNLAELKVFIIINFNLCFIELINSVDR